MTQEEKRAAIAEAMGYKRHPPSRENILPDPFTCPNDLQAVEDFILDRWDLSVSLQDDFVDAEIWKRKAPMKVSLMGSTRIRHDGSKADRFRAKADAVVTAVLEALKGAEHE